MPCVILPKIHPGVFTFDCAARDPAEKERQVELG
jgi:hypothetical protein